MRRKTIWTVAIICAVVLLGLAGCGNSVGPQFGDGMGKVVVSFNNGAKTIAPSLDIFTKYTLSFLGPVSQPPLEVTGGSASFELVPGEWKIIATGYIGDVAAAEGSVTIIVKPGLTTQAKILLSPKAAAEPGYFKFKITLPSGASGVLDILVAYPDKPLAAGVNEGRYELAAGQYLLMVRLEKGDLKAGFTDALHIYAGQESYLELVYNDADFVSSVNAGFDLTGLITAPELLEAPDTSGFETDQFTGTIVWKDEADNVVDGVFRGNTKYKAVVTLTPKSGYTFIGVPAGSFTYDGAEVIYDANSDTITIVFPKTEVEVLGDGDITIGFNYGQITVTGSDGVNSIQAPLALTLKIAGYDNVTWYVDGNPASAVSGNTMILNASDYAYGTHSVSFIGYINGIMYGQPIPFYVEVPKSLGVTKVNSLQRITYLNTLINQAEYPQVKTLYGDTSFTGNYRPDQSWDCYGWGDNGKLYFGWTTYNGLARKPNNTAVTSAGVSSPNATRGGSSQEDFLIFCYDPATQKVKYIDSFMETSRRQGNLRWHDGSDRTIPHSEETPKGHTRFVNIGDGYLYMASQPFHDWKQYLWRSDDVFPFPLEDFRGGKIFRLDPSTDTLVDLSATMANTPAPGVTTEHEGIIALDYMKSTGLLVGMTHPNGSLVFVDPVANAVVRYVKAIPWTLQGLTVGRDFAIDDINQKIYLCRGNEGNSSDGTGRSTMRDVYVYDWKTDTTTKTDSQVFGGMWGTTVVTPDGKTAYATACGGHLFKIDFETGKTTWETFLSPFSNPTNPTTANLSQLYWVIPSPDWTRLYSMPSLLNNATQNGLWEYNLLTKEKKIIHTLGSGNTNSNVFTSQKDLLRDGKLYTISAGSQTSTSSWNSSSSSLATNAAACIIFVFDLEFNQ